MVHNAKTFLSVLFEQAQQAEWLLEQKEKKEKWFGECVHFGT